MTNASILSILAHVTPTPTSTSKVSHAAGAYCGGHLAAQLVIYTPVFSCGIMEHQSFNRGSPPIFCSVFHLALSIALFLALCGHFANNYMNGWHCCAVITWSWYSMPMLMLLSIMATRMARWTCRLSTKLLTQRRSLVTLPPAPSAASTSRITHHTANDIVINLRNSYVILFPVRYGRVRSADRSNRGLKSAGIKHVSGVGGQ